MTSIKTLADLRKFDLKVDAEHMFFSKIGDLKRRKLDFDVFLPSLGINLQRECVWSIEQKRELIISVFIQRNIPNICILSIIDKEDTSKDIIQVIDGKQRLVTFIEFLNDEFSILLEGQEFKYSELPEDYQRAYFYHNIFAKVAYDQYDYPIKDEQKIEWFTRINFFGTPVDIKHLEKLQKK